MQTYTRLTFTIGDIFFKGVFKSHIPDGVLVYSVFSRSKDFEHPDQDYKLIYASIYADPDSKQRDRTVWKLTVVNREGNITLEQAQIIGAAIEKLLLSQ